MKISDIIVESADCESGWQEPETYFEPIRGGTILLRERLNENCDTDEYAFVYYNKKMSKYQDGWIVSYVMRNEKIIWYDVFKHREGQVIGHQSSLSKDDVKMMFLNSIAEYL